MALDASAAVEAESSTCPPWLDSLIRDAQVTSSPVDPSIVRMGSPVWIPMHTRMARPRGHGSVARARWICTTAATAWVAQGDITKHASP
jgi:hypothetical protein